MRRMNAGALGRLVVGLPKFGDLIQLPCRRLLVGLAKKKPFDSENRRTEPATPNAGVGRVAQFRIIDVASVVAAEVLLRNEAGGVKRLAVVRVRRRKELADHRQGPCSSAPCLPTTRRITCDQECSALLSKIARISGWLRNFPQTGEAYPIRMDNPPETLVIDTPAQIGMGIDSSGDCLAKEVRPTGPHRSV